MMRRRVKHLHLRLRLRRSIRFAGLHRGADETEAFPGSVFSSVSDSHSDLVGWAHHLTARIFFDFAWGC